MSWKHGSSAYRHGCRCDFCVAYNATRTRAYRADRLTSKRRENLANPHLCVVCAGPLSEHRIGQCLLRST